MDRVPLLLLTVLPCSVFCVHLPTPVKLSMVSQNFVHLLSWEAGLGSPDGVTYTVIARSVSTAWQTVESCATVRSPLRCNLTEVFSNPDETYFINVTGRLGSLTSQPACYDSFQPLKHTILDPPFLNVSTCNESLCVQLQTPSETHLSIYQSFKYKLDITSSGEFKFSKEVQGLKDVVLEHLEPGKEYCVNISIIDYNSTNRPAVCASTIIPESNSVSDAVISVVLFLAVLLVSVTTALSFASGFFCLKIRLPSVLSSIEVYKVFLMRWPTVESLTTVSLEPGIVADVKGDGEMEGERDEEVAYERRRARCEETSDNTGSSSSIPPSSDIHPKAPYEETCSRVLQINTSPESESTSLCLEPALKPPCRPEFGLNLKSQATNQISATGSLSDMLRNKDLSFLGHKYKEKEGQDDEEECRITVDFFSLKLGGRMYQTEKKDNADNLQIQEQVAPSSNINLNGAENLTDIQPTYSAKSDTHVTNSDQEEEEEEEEDHSDYLKRS